MRGSKQVGCAPTGRPVGNAKVLSGARRAVWWGHMHVHQILLPYSHPAARLRGSMRACASRCRAAHLPVAAGQVFVWAPAVRPFSLRLHRRSAPLALRQRCAAGRPGGLLCTAPMRRHTPRRSMAQWRSTRTTLGRTACLGGRERGGQHVSRLLRDGAELREVGKRSVRVRGRRDAMGCDARTAAQRAPGAEQRLVLAAVVPVHCASTARRRTRRGHILAGARWPQGAQGGPRARRCVGCLLRAHTRPCRGQAAAAESGTLSACAFLCARAAAHSCARRASVGGGAAGRALPHWRRASALCRRRDALRALPGRHGDARDEG
jgi:hypothetical protein